MHFGLNPSCAKPLLTALAYLHRLISFIEIWINNSSTDHLHMFNGNPAFRSDAHNRRGKAKCPAY